MRAEVGCAVWQPGLGGRCENEQAIMEGTQLVGNAPGRALYLRQGAWGQALRFKLSDGGRKVLAGLFADTGALMPGSMGGEGRGMGGKGMRCGRQSFASCIRNSSAVDSFATRRHCIGSPLMWPFGCNEVGPAFQLDRPAWKDRPTTSTRRAGILGIRTLAKG